MIIYKYTLEKMSTASDDNFFKKSEFYYIIRNNKIKTIILDNIFLRH